LKAAQYFGVPKVRALYEATYLVGLRKGRDAGRMTATLRLAAIVAADVAGYSRLMGADEEGTHERLKAHRRELFDPKIREHSGRLVKTTGDGMLVEFSSVVDAVRCAAEVQRAMIDREAEIRDDGRIRYRIGINLGDVIVEDDDIFGDGVNVAARLEALSDPGGLCISRMVRDQIRDKLAYAFEDLGEQSVKNIARPVRVYALRPEAVADLPAPSAPPALPISQLSAVPRLSIVVLPFANLSNDPEQEYFADGITEDLATDLSRLANMFVISRNTAFTYRNKPIDTKQIGRELGVRYVLEGSVRRIGDQVRVNVQLIDAETAAHIWADRFETERADLAKTQDAITGRLARTLNLELFEAASRGIEQERAANPDARDFAMRAWARVLRGPQSQATFEEALSLNQRALEIDPGSVDAKNYMASILLGKLSNGWSSSIQEDQAQVEKLFREVLERNPNDARAHIGVGILRRVQNRLAEAKIELETGVTLDRNNTMAFRNIGLTLIQMGKPEEAIPYIEKSIQLNPHDPTMFNNYGALGQCHLLLGHLDQAIEFLRKASTANPRAFGIHSFGPLGLAGALGLRGDLSEAKAEIAEAIKLEPKVNSLAALRAFQPFFSDPRYLALAEKTLYAGLRHAGFPDE
jgi:TolB-like protein/Flp pilus assembly protein TadD